MLTPKVKRQIQQIIPFPVIFFLFSLMYVFLEKGILGASEIYPSTGNPYSFKSSILVTSSLGIVFGTITGVVEILFLNKVFTKSSFTKKIIYKTLIYIFINFLFASCGVFVSNSIELETNVLDPKAWNNYKMFISNFAFWSIEIYMAFILLITLFYSEVSNSLGQNVLINFLTGKYHNSIQEERIFMLLDMKSSTSIAEKLGHQQYFEMLKDYYADLSDPIINYAGEVYQYVGDEIVVSWKLKAGIVENNCIHCFFAMQEAIKNRSDRYLKRYGLVPGFKAALHYGNVTAGEIGTLKKNITYSGDVLNTTARIQGLCNYFGVQILISEYLFQKLNLESEFETANLGEAELRGRLKKINIYTIKSKNSN